MEEDIKIIQNKEVPNGMNYDFLRKEAIVNTQKISGDIWTDYNAHDPGVTILEQFSYALTDISFRTNLDIETILFHEGDKQSTLKKHALIPPEIAFSPGVVTINDYRILILDHFSGVLSNCWISKVNDHLGGIIGLYNIEILVKSHVQAKDYDQIKLEVKKLFHAHRNLCEDISRISILNPEKLSLSFEIDIDQRADTEDILSKILFVIERYFNPLVPFFTLEQMISDGKSMEEIYGIPSFKNGFIKEEFLREKADEFYVSKLTDNILDIRGVRDVLTLQLGIGGIPILGDVIEVPNGKFLTLGIIGQGGQPDLFKNFDLSLQKGGTKENFNIEAVLYATELLNANTEPSYKILKKSKEKINKVKTKTLNTYLPIQRSFPELFGVGTYIPSSEESPLRKAKSAQLRGYLAFFDQIMANHLAQLSSISRLLNVTDFGGTSQSTYFGQKIEDRLNDSKELFVKKLISADKLEKLIKELNDRKNQLNEKEVAKLKDLRLDLKDKFKEVEKIVKSDWKPYENDLKNIRRLKRKYVHPKTHDLINEIYGLGQRIKTTSKIKSNDVEKLDGNKIDELKVTLLERMSAELLDKDLFVSMSADDLSKIISVRDDCFDRKNRLIHHVLARFGEDFRYSFKAYFDDSVFMGKSQREIEREYLMTKSSFLNEVIYANKYLAKGINILSEDANINPPPFKRKVSYIMGFVDNSPFIVKDDFKNSLSPKKLTSASIDELTNSKTQKKSIVLKSGVSSDKVTFLINSSKYVKYLFQYGSNQKNYSLEQENDKYIIHFNPPTGENSTKLIALNSESAAKEKLLKILQYFAEKNQSCQNFHVVEHILLRPVDQTQANYILLDENKKNELFQSITVVDETSQINAAKDAIILASYVNNYIVLSSNSGDYKVILKNAIGTYLAKSIKAFQTEGEAKKFISSSVDSFQIIKNEKQFSNYIKLDNTNEFLFQLLDEKNEVLISGLEPESIPENNQRSNYLLSYAKEIDHYKVIEESPDLFIIYLLDDSKRKIGRSEKQFSSLIKSQDYIKDLVVYFEDLVQKGSKDLNLRYYRIGSRTANDFNFRLSIVYPNWTAKFNRKSYFKLFRKVLFDSLPAHLSVSLVGLDFDQMHNFEKLYFNYLSKLREDSIETRSERLSMSGKIFDLLITNDSH